ncbi:hypothetical protein T229_15870 [Tannerella sp. oral taxon BU063 isolate Cell 5]|uniref:Uncharacterized protein n=1 Tax=Tannerella sp. oral taxon BU063 isolate Cell 5 TaxID=1410950 RepID=W2C7R8_9BACT|nr:hypothetical protein T229_15870 [Tannerella sp. oral taxon BU063 isolate Cell 5]
MGGEHLVVNVCPPSEASGTPAKLAGYQEYFAGGRSRPAAAPRGRKGPNRLFEGFRGVGKAQTSCLKVSEGSERLKQVV